jgi:methionyl-tRNA formyltransferase
MATTFLNNEVVKINKARFLKEAPVYKNIHGQILSKTNSGYLVKTQDSFIEITEFNTENALIVGGRFKNE